ncbi:hypothetical protein J3P95_13515 [Pseudomonas sp. Z5-35]
MISVPVAENGVAVVAQTIGDTLESARAPLSEVLSGPAKDLSLQLSHVTHRAKDAQAGDDIDRLYIVIQ